MKLMIINVKYVPYIFVKSNFHYNLLIYTIIFIYFILLYRVIYY